MAIKAREDRIDVLQGTLDMLITKYYRLTHAGKKQLVAEQSKWERMLKAIRLVMRPTEE
jgi:hypothetical protein